MAFCCAHVYDFRAHSASGTQNAVEFRETNYTHEKEEAQPKGNTSSFWSE